MKDERGVGATSHYRLMYDGEDALYSCQVYPDVTTFSVS